jgi:hypothetical protein
MKTQEAPSLIVEITPFLSPSLAIPKILRAIADQLEAQAAEQAVIIDGTTYRWLMGHTLQPAPSAPGV